MQDSILSTVTFSSKVNLYYGLFPVILHNRLRYLSRPETEREIFRAGELFSKRRKHLQRLF